MRRNVLPALLLIASFVFSVFSLGGCGGSGSSDENSSAPGRTSVFIGTTGGDLYEALQSKLKFSRNVSGNDSSDIAGSLVEGDVAVFGIGWCSNMNADKTALLKELYEKGVTIALLEPDDEQVNAMRNALGLIADDSVPSHEEWAETLSDDGYTASEEWTGTVSLYALAKGEDEDDSSYWYGSNTMTYIIPNDSSFAADSTGTLMMTTE